MLSPVTDRYGVDLRQEAWKTAPGFPTSLRTMREVVGQWREAVKDNRDTWATFEDEEGNQESAELTDRHHPDEFDKRYSKLNDLAEGLREKFTVMTTVMVSLSASSTDEEGYARPSVDHLHDLDASSDAVNVALHRVLEGRRWERLAVPEQHDSGYIHWHWAIFVEGRVDAEEFRPVIDAHVRNCPGAEHEAHRISPDGGGGAVSVREEGESLPGPHGLHAR